ncbi:MAG: hypothetical protein AB8G22_01825 [Saprospiraceae bacterium]
MSVFENIELEIEAVSQELNAVISRDRPGYTESLRTFEERRIDWEDNDIKKAIIIQPTFESTGVNSEIWNFILFAYKGIGRKQIFYEALVEKSDFEVIETNIKELLESGKETLLKIKEENLGPFKG